MSLDDLHLNSWLRNNLYGNHLVKKRPLQEAETLDNDKNKKSAPTSELLLLVKEPNHEFAGPDEYQLLERLLKACHIQIEDTQRINLATSGNDVEELIQQFAPERVIVFGKAMSLPEDVKADKPGTVSFSGAKILVAPTLAALNKQSSLRMPLWERLQQFFELNETGT